MKIPSANFLDIKSIDELPRFTSAELMNVVYEYIYDMHSSTNPKRVLRAMLGIDVSEDLFEYIGAFNIEISYKKLPNGTTLVKPLFNKKELEIMRELIEAN